MPSWPWREVQGSGIARETEIILRTLDMFVPDREGTYLAAPISTGLRYYEALARHGAASYSALIDAIGEEEYLRTVRWPNVAEGEQIAADLRQRGVPYVINTSPLMASGWRGSDYMNLCFALVEKKVARVYFHPRWAFSSGAVQEFLFCHRRGVPCLRIDGQVLSIEEARTGIREVCRFLRANALPFDSFDLRLRELGSQ